MEFDFKTLLYIAFGIIYFIFSAKKKGIKKAEGPSNPERGGETVGPPPMRQPTFEELLQEFTGKKVETIQPAPVPVQAKPKIEPKTQFMEVPKIERRTILENVALNKRKAMVDTEVEVEEEENELASYAETLHDLEGAKRAFVFSEIFQRKY